MEAATARCAVTFAAAVSFFPQEKRPEAPAAVSRAPSTREKVSGVPVLSAPTRDRETAVVMLSATPATSEESHGTREARKRRTTHTAPSTRAHASRPQLREVSDCTSSFTTSPTPTSSESTGASAWAWTEGAAGFTAAGRTGCASSTWERCAPIARSSAGGASARAGEERESSERTARDDRDRRRMGAPGKGAVVLTPPARRGAGSGARRPPPRALGWESVRLHPTVAVQDALVGGLEDVQVQFPVEVDVSDDRRSFGAVDVGEDDAAGARLLLLAHGVAPAVMGGLSRPGERHQGMERAVADGAGASARRSTARARRASSRSMPSSRASMRTACLSAVVWAEETRAASDSVAVARRSRWRTSAPSVPHCTASPSKVKTMGTAMTSQGEGFDSEVGVLMPAEKGRALTGRAASTQSHTGTL